MRKAARAVSAGRTGEAQLIHVGGGGGGGRRRAPGALPAAECSRRPRASLFLVFR